MCRCLHLTGTAFRDMWSNRVRVWTRGAQRRGIVVTGPVIFADVCSAGNVQLDYSWTLLRGSRSGAVRSERWDCGLWPTFAHPCLVSSHEERVNERMCRVVRSRSRKSPQMGSRIRVAGSLLADRSANGAITVAEP